MPCAQRLCTWIMETATAEIKIDLDFRDFQKASGESRKRPYCLRQIRNAYNCLIEIGLLDQVFSSGKNTKGVIFHNPSAKQNAQQLNKTSRKTPSNPCKSVPILRKELNTIQFAVENGGKKDLEDPSITQESTERVKPARIPGFEYPVTEKEKALILAEEGLHKKEVKPDQQTNLKRLDPPKKSPEIKTQRKLEREAAAVIAPARINYTLRNLIARAKKWQVKAAIAAVRERISEGKCFNPAGALNKALQEGWKPNKGSLAQPENKDTPEGFLEWYSLANRIDLAKRWFLEGGNVFVLLTSHNPLDTELRSFAECLIDFPVSWLRLVADHRQIPIDPG